MDTVVFGRTRFFETLFSVIRFGSLVHFDDDDDDRYRIKFDRLTSFLII